MNGTNPSLMRAIRGPVTLIVVGVLFALDHFTAYSFQQTWPVMLIVFGVLTMFGREARPRYVPPAPAAGPVEREGPGGAQ
jgi:hypothetical protein